MEAKHGRNNSHHCQDLESCYIKMSSCCGGINGARLLSKMLSTLAPTPSSPSLVVTGSHYQCQRVGSSPENCQSWRSRPAYDTQRPIVDPRDQDCCSLPPP